MDFQPDPLQPLLEALHVTPDNLPLKRHVAKLLYEAGRYPEALEHFQALEARQELEDCAFLLAKTYYHLGQYLESGSVLKRVMREDAPGEYALLLSKVNFALGEKRMAEQYYRQAVRRDPDLADSSYAADLEDVGSRANAPSAKPGDDLQRARAFASDGRDLLDAEEADPGFGDFMEKPNVTFDDVGGLAELKENIRLQIIYPFQNPELYVAYGKKIGGGILLYGPPGCGKTHIARATAGECGAHFISLAINEILDMYIGQSEKNLHEIFELARRHRPTIVFIDEMDALGATRSHQSSRHDRSLTSQLLTELDGINTDNDGILTLAATNTPWFIDPALRRPGRFDRTLFVPPPDLEARKQVLEIHLKGKPVENIDYEKVAKATEQYSGADLMAVCEVATEVALQEAMKSGQPKPIRTDQLVKAVKKVKPSTLEWLATAKNYATYSNQGGQYDDILTFLNKR